MQSVSYLLIVALNNLKPNREKSFITTGLFGADYRLELLMTIIYLDVVHKELLTTATD